MDVQNQYNYVYPEFIPYETFSTTSWFMNVNHIEAFHFCTLTPIQRNCKTFRTYRTIFFHIPEPESAICWCRSQFIWWQEFHIGYSFLVPIEHIQWQIRMTQIKVVYVMISRTNLPKCGAQIQNNAQQDYLHRDRGNMKESNTPANQTCSFSGDLRIEQKIRTYCNVVARSWVVFHTTNISLHIYIESTGFLPCTPHFNLHHRKVNPFTIWFDSKPRTNNGQRKNSFSFRIKREFM